MSLARSFHSDPHGMIFIHASGDQPLMNSPIRKLSFVILSKAKNLFTTQSWRFLELPPQRSSLFAKRDNLF